MKREDKIERWIDDTLNVAGNIESVESNPFLFEKIKHRMAHEEEEKLVRKPILIPALRLVALVVLVFMNIWFVGGLGESSLALTNDTMEQSIDVIMDSYSLETTENSIYN